MLNVAFIISYFVYKDQIISTIVDKSVGGAVGSGL